ncbi:MAG TPA: hypothetical protein VID24_07245 [Candidatus Eremiobacteraceae bacterium]
MTELNGSVRGRAGSTPLRGARRTSVRGFSLIESLIAFVLGLLSILALVGIFPTGLTAIQQGSDSVQAQSIAQAYLDYIREYYQTEGGLPASFPASGVSFDCTPGSLQPLMLQSAVQQQLTFGCVYTYANVGGVGKTPEHRIEFTVSWTTEQRGAQTRTYEEYVVN